MKELEVYQCPECGLHYKDEAIAKECEEYCRENNACSIEITQHSIEVSQNN